MATYTAYSDNAYLFKVSVSGDILPGKTITIGSSRQFVYSYDYKSQSASQTLSYSIDGGNWVSVGTGGTVNIPTTAKKIQLRLSYSGNIIGEETKYRETQVETWDYLRETKNTAGQTVLVREGFTYRTEVVAETHEVSLYYKAGTWYSETITLNNNPTISGSDSNLGEKSTAFNIEYSVNDTDTSDAITVKCYYDDALITTINNAIRNQKYLFMVSNEMLASSPINSTHTIKITASGGNGTVTRTYKFVKNRNPEPYMDYTIKPVQTEDMASIIVVGQLAGKGQSFHVSVYVCNNAFDDQPMWENMSSQYYHGLSYNFVNTSKTADKWGVSVRFVNSKSNENDQIDIAGCGFWCDKMIVRS